MKKFYVTLIAILAIVQVSVAQSFNLPGDGKWYRLATMGGMHADLQYIYAHGTGNNPSIASGELEFINAQNFMVQRHQTMGYAAWNQPQFALINLGNSSEIWVKATNGVSTFPFTITKNVNATLNLGDLNDADLSNNGGTLSIYDKLADNSQIIESNLLIPHFYVAIGSSVADPNYQLSVKGKIHAKEIKVETSNFPDYVFKPNYKLPTLTSLEKYISKNKHLPGVPTADEVTKEGMELGEMNKLLMKKVEELTLYLIEKDKQMQDQQTTKMSLQKQIDRILKKSRRKRSHLNGKLIPNTTMI